MDSKIVLNEYIKADIVSDVVSQSIEEARQKLTKENSKEAKEILDKWLRYREEVKKGNKEIINKILEGEI